VSEFACDRRSGEDDNIRLRDEAARRVARVWRLGPGDRFLLLDDCETEREIEVLSIDGHEVIGRSVQSRSVAAEPSLQLTVLHGVPKGHKLDTVIQKCAELGVRELVPILTDRAVPRLDDLRRERRLARWRKISRQATEQCGRASVMDVSETCSLRDAVAAHRCADLKLVLYEGSADGFRHRVEGTEFSSAVIAVGPEGGFTRHEVDVAAEHGFPAVSMGPRILRTETVAPTVAGILMYVHGDL